MHMLRQPITIMPVALRNDPMIEQSVTRAMVARALADDRVCAVYQPVVDARQMTRVAFHEALVRLRTSSGRLMAPGQFLPAVAGTQLAVELDCVVLRQALEAMQHRPTARISVNIGVETLDSPMWMDLLTSFTADQPDLAFRLIVELTEDTSVLNHPNCGAFLHRLQQMGVTTALDDFGAGATGFAWFREHRFDVVKIDGSFGDGLNQNRDSQVLVKALVDISHHFEMMTVIEYIDSPADAARAMRMGIDCMQGFLFGRPEPELRTHVPPTDIIRRRDAC